jgi:hypothetical protein
LILIIRWNDALQPICYGINSGIGLSYHDGSPVYPPFLTAPGHFRRNLIKVSLEGKTITLMAASKTFNLPGLGCVFAVIGEENPRRRFKEAMAEIVPKINTFRNSRLTPNL